MNYVHADHLGAPQKMTDASRSIVWDASFLPFGEEDSLIGSAANDNRFPGQRLTAETGLNYNYFRDFDPTTGRYLQSDPIGLAGGINTYGYVSGNPVNYVDPTGEFACGGVCIAGGLILGGVGLDILYELYENDFKTECIDWEAFAVELGLGAIIPPVFKPAKYAAKFSNQGVTKSSMRRLKRLIKNLSNNSRKDNGLSQEQIGKLRKMVEKAGGKLRNDGTSGVKGSSAGKSHMHTEGLGKSIDSRHIWTQNGVK